MKNFLFILCSLLLTFAPSGQMVHGATLGNLEQMLKNAVMASAHPVSAKDSNVLSSRIDETSGISEIIFSAPKNRFSIHKKQMVFRNDVYQKVNDVDVSAAENTVKLRFDANKFEAYAIKLNTKNYNYELPVMVDEVTSWQYDYTVSVSVILQERNKNNQLTSFYFLIPKEKK